MAYDPRQWLGYGNDYNSEENNQQSYGNRKPYKDDYQYKPTQGNFYDVSSSDNVYTPSTRYGNNSYKDYTLSLIHI